MGEFPENPSLERSLLAQADHFEVVEVVYDQDVFMPPKELYVVKHDLPSTLLTVRPTAVEHIEQILSTIEAAGRKVVCVLEDEEYIDLSKHLYGTPNSEDINSFLWILAMRGYFESIPPSLTIVLDEEFDQLQDYEDSVTNLKRTIRDVVGRRYFECMLGNEALRTWIHPVHAADFMEREFERDLIVSHSLQYTH